MSLETNKNKTNEEAVYEFVNAINEGSVDKIYSLMADDHLFVDAQCNQVHGKEKMKAGWASYFQLFRDYKIEITDMICHGELVAAFGFAEGSYRDTKSNNDKNHWRLPASWKIIVEKGKIKLWQVYADTKIPFDIINRNK